MLRRLGGASALGCLLRAAAPPAGAGAAAAGALAPAATGLATAAALHGALLALRACCHGAPRQRR
jgi:hypothetical protein